MSVMPGHRSLFPALLVGAALALAAPAEARPPFHHCRQSVPPGVWFDIRASGTDCATARRVARNTIVSPDGKRVLPPAGGFWACRIVPRRSLGPAARRVACHRFESAAVRFTTRAF